MFGFLSFLSLLSLVFASSLQSRATAAFAANAAVDARSLLTAAKAANKKSVAAYQPDPGSKQWVNIYADWLDSAGVFHFIADMDVDCDGADYQCAGNTDGQSETSFGALDARKVPFFVLPLSFSQKFGKNIKPNSLGAIVCNGKMFYGIFGDQNGASPEVIGEASLLLAQSCFPNDGLNGNNGHDPLDVLYIVFGSVVPTGVGRSTIDVAALKALGDKHALLLQGAILEGGSNKGDGGDDNIPSTTKSRSTTSVHPTKTVTTSSSSNGGTKSVATSPPKNNNSGNNTMTATTTSKPLASSPSTTRTCKPRSGHTKRHRRRLTSPH